MQQSQTSLTISTPGRGFVEITTPVQRWLHSSGLESGLLTLFIQHTSASLTIQENADSDVLRDLTAFLERMAPEETHLYRHILEGADDMPAHIRSMVTSVSLTIPFSQRRLLLGTWQGIYVIEHRRATHQRRVIAHAIGQD